MKTEANGASPEVVAAITAAVQMMMGKCKSQH